MKKEAIKCYYSSDFVTLKILSDVNNTEFVAILIRFLGTSALPFCLRCANTACALWRMFNTGKAKGQRSPAIISWAARSTLCTVTHACWTCATVVVLAQRNKRFKVFTVKKQIRMCNYKIFYGKYLDIHIDKKSTLSAKVDMAIFFQWQYRQYQQIEISLKNDIPKYRRSLL